MEHSARDFLAGAMEAWLAESPKRTSRLLSSRSGVPYETIRRYQDNNRNNQPPFDVAFRVLSVVASHADLERYMSSYHPAVYEWVKAYKDVNHTDSDCIPDWDAHTKDRLCYKIFALSSSRGGLKASDLSRLNGQEGLDTANQLVDQGLLDERDGSFFVKFSEYATQSIEANLDRVKHCADLFDDRAIDEDVGFIATHSERVNLEGIKQIKAALKRCYVDISRIKQDDKYKGDIPFYANLLQGVFDLEKVIEAKEAGQ